MTETDATRGLDVPGFHVVLEGEDAERFAAMLRHNETCRGADEAPPCEKCARRQATLNAAREMVERWPRV